MATSHQPHPSQPLITNSHLITKPHHPPPAINHHLPTHHPSQSQPKHPHALAVVRDLPAIHTLPDGAACALQLLKMRPRHMRRAQLCLAHPPHNRHRSPATTTPDHPSHQPHHLLLLNHPNPNPYRPLQSNHPSSRINTLSSFIPISPTPPHRLRQSSGSSSIKRGQPASSSLLGVVLPLPDNDVPCQPHPCPSLVVLIAAARTRTLAHAPRPQSDLCHRGVAHADCHAAVHGLGKQQADHAPSTAAVRQPGHHRPGGRCNVVVLRQERAAVPARHQANSGSNNALPCSAQTNGTSGCSTTASTCHHPSTDSSSPDRAHSHHIHASVGPQPSPLPSPHPSRTCRASSQQTSTRPTHTHVCWTSSPARSTTSPSPRPPIASSATRPTPPRPTLKANHKRPPSHGPHLPRVGRPQIPRRRAGCHEPPLCTQQS